MDRICSLESLALPKLAHYEELVNRIDMALMNQGYEKNLAFNYAPFIVNSFFDFDTDRYLDKVSMQTLSIPKETKRLHNAVSDLHKQGIYVTLEDYLEFRHEYDSLRKEFAKEH
jgi:hypothetical protein